MTMKDHQPSLPRHSTACATFARLAPLLDTGELDAEREAWAREHLTTCASCRRQLAGYEVTTAALRRHYGGVRAFVSLPTAEELMTIADRDAPYEEMSTERMPTPPRPFRSPLAPSRARRLVAAGLTAAMVLAVIGTLFALRGQARPTSPAAPKTSQTTHSAHGAIGEITLGGKLTSPTAIAAGKDGALWILDPQTNTIGRMSSSGTITTFNVPTPNSGLTDLAIAPDGSVWFTESKVNQIGRISPSGVIAEFKGIHSGGRPFAIAAGANGVMWFTDLNTPPGLGNKVVPIHADGSIGSFILAMPYPDPELLGITTTPDGAVWFTEANNGRVDRLDPALLASGTYPPTFEKQFSLQNTASDPTAIATAPDGSVWFVLRGVNAIGHLTTAGKLTAFPVTAPGSGLSSLAVASDGTVWFTDAKANRIGSISPSGEVNEKPIPTASAGLSGITIGPDGRIWFAETASGKIGYVTP